MLRFLLIKLFEKIFLLCNSDNKTNLLRKRTTKIRQYVRIIINRFRCIFLLVFFSK